MISPLQNYTVQVIYIETVFFLNFHNCFDSIRNENVIDENEISLETKSLILHNVQLPHKE